MAFTGEMDSLPSQGKQTIQWLLSSSWGWHIAIFDCSIVSCGPCCQPKHALSFWSIQNQRYSSYISYTQPVSVKAPQELDDINPQNEIVLVYYPPWFSGLPFPYAADLIGDQLYNSGPARWKRDIGQGMGKGCEASMPSWVLLKYPPVGQSGEFPNPTFLGFYVSSII